MLQLIRNKEVIPIARIFAASSVFRGYWCNKNKEVKRDVDEGTKESDNK